MDLRPYLPSSQFVLLTVSLFVSATLVYGATLYTRGEQPSASLSAAEQVVVDNDWQEVLQKIQEQDPSYTLPEPPSGETVAAFLAEAESSNLTDTVGRSLLINLSNAKSQGLGDDVPTQEQIIALAASKLQGELSYTPYKSQDFISVAATSESLHTYGNDVMEVLARYPNTNVEATLRALIYGVENNDAEQFAVLGRLAKEYKEIADVLARVNVPQTLVPLHLQVVNGFLRIASEHSNMQSLAQDPLRALVGLQNYYSVADEVSRVFTTLAEQFDKNAIIFNEDEPGHTWSAFLNVQ